MEAENPVAVLHPHCGALANRVESRSFGAQPFIRQPQLENACTPVGNVKEHVEVLVHPYVCIALEVSPGIIIDEARRRNSGPCRVGAQFCHFLLAQWPVNSLELKLLALTHYGPPEK